MQVSLDFLIIGAQKSASTLLHRCLIEHPQIYMPHEEMNNFESPFYENGGIDSLNQRLVCAPKGRLVGIKRPDYLALANCAKRISHHAPNSQLIILLRNPISRAVSAYYHLMVYGFIPIENVNTGLPKIINGEYTYLFPKSNEILEYGFYAKHISNYLAYFDKSKLLILLDEDFHLSGLDFLVKIYDFLGVDNSYIPKCLSKRENVGIYSLERLKFINLRNKILFEYTQDRMNLSIRRNLIATLLNLSIVGIDRVILKSIFGNTKPKIDSEIITMLAGAYENDIKNLEKLLDRDLSSWLR